MLYSEDSFLAEKLSEFEGKADIKTSVSHVRELLRKKEESLISNFNRSVNTFYKVLVPLLPDYMIRFDPVDEEWEVHKVVLDDKEDKDSDLRRELPYRCYINSYETEEKAMKAVEAFRKEPLGYKAVPKDD